MLVKRSLLAALVSLLQYQQVTSIDISITNSTSNSSASISNQAISATHSVTYMNDYGGTDECIGPTPTAAFTWPERTAVELHTYVPSGATTAISVFSTYSAPLVPQFEPYQDPGKCCGQCTVYFSGVDVMYWPVAGANTACLDSGTVAGVPSAQATVPPLNNSITTTVGPDGFTYTSPSIYVAYHDLSASNFCGQVGPKHTSITLSFEPGQLSTLDYSPGIFGWGGNPGLPKPFDLKNLPCPPESLIDAEAAANQPGLKLPLRGTYAPIIAPPPAIQSLEPAWNTCVSFYAFDPPKTLNPAAAMMPSPTPAGNSRATVTAATPSPTLDGPPIQTSITSSKIDSDPADNSSDPKVAVDPTTAAHSIPTGADPKGDSAHNVLPVTGTLVPLGDNEASSKPSEPPPNPTSDISAANDPHSQSHEPADGSSSLGPVVVVGSHTITALPSGGFAIAGSTLQATSSPAPVIAVGSHTFTALPSGGFAIAGSTLQADDPAITVLGTPISVGSSQIVAGSSTVDIPSGNSNGVFTAAGQVFTPQSDAGFVVAGNTVSVNGPAATVSGKVDVSLAPAGLIMGSQTFAVPTLASNPTGSVSAVLTMGGHTVIPLGTSSIVVQGATLSINGPATTISGIALSLGSSGVVIGTQTYALPTSTPGKLGDTVVIDGTTLTAGGSVVTIANTPVSLATGSAGGLYIAGLGSGSAAFSAPVMAGESISVNPAGQIAVDGQTVSGSGASSMGLGSAIMLGFGAASTVVANSAAGGGSASAMGNASSGTGVVGFTGEGRKSVNVPTMGIFTSVCVMLGWYLRVYVIV